MSAPPAACRAACSALVVPVVLWLPVAAGAQGYAFPSTCADGCMTVSSYYDNGAGTAVTDHACGGHSYNGHRGTDFAPYGGFTAMDEGRAVTAAAPGTVITAHDGEFDRCTSGVCAGGGGFGNYVTVAQDDGVTAYYAHLRRGSLRVAVGALVSCGRELGLIGSSGYSTGVHLHFETRRGGVASDPFGGGCSGGSAWAVQGPYRGLPRAVCAAPPTDPPPEEPPPEEPPPEPPPVEPPPEPPAPTCVPESCNAADDDCDGGVDEAPECAAASVRFAPGALPLSLGAGTTTRVVLRLRNDGAVAWTTDEHWAAASGERLRARVSRGIHTGVPPGGVIEIELTITTTTAGRARVFLYLRRGASLATAIWLWTVDVLEGTSATESAPVDPPTLADPPPAPAASDAGPTPAVRRPPGRSPVAPSGCSVADDPASGAAGLVFLILFVRACVALARVARRRVSAKD